MNDFEKRLRTISLKKSPEDLRERIFGIKPRTRMFSIFPTVRISLAWVAVAAMMMWALGFFTAYLMKPSKESEIMKKASYVDVRIIYETPDKGNMFDFTDVSSDFLPGDCQVQVETNGGV